MIPRDPKRVADFVVRICALAPLMQKHRDSFDRERRLPPPVFAAIAEAGLFKLWVPKALGGAELSPLDFMEVVEAASGVDGSVGWLVGNGGGMSRIGGYLPAEIAGAWFADPLAFIAAATGATGTATPVEGGYRVTGRWPFGSGIHHATRVMGLSAIETSTDRAATDLVCCYFAPQDVSVIDNWHVSGLRGTGSCDFEVKDVFVPSAHVHNLVDLEPTEPGLLYCMPHRAVFALTVSVVPLGIANAALASFVNLAGRVRPGASQALGARETIQADVGRADAVIRAARAFLVEAIDGLMAATDIGGERLERARVVFRLACTHAAETATSVVDRLAAAAGAVSIFESCELERRQRDVRAAVRHIAMSPNNYILGGRVHLGIDPGTVKF